LPEVPVGDTTIHAQVSGSGPPVLLLHGWPQTHSMWRDVAPVLAQDFTVVATDLTGYGASGKPPSTPDHARHSKRAFAQDQRKVMASLGFERFAVAGHDRGARTAYRMALDHPNNVTRVAVLDILPTAEALARIDADTARRVWWWFLLSAPHPVPERLMPGDAETVHAMCEDYRAMMTIDREHDEQDRAAGRRIAAPLLALWGTRTLVGRDPEDPLAVWRRWADDVSGHALDCGHDLPQEAPDETAQALRTFLSA
jgi:haloacetate dehalogenase